MSESPFTFHSNFYTRLQGLNNCNSDGLAFAKALFDPAGNLRDHIRDTGPWGKELETGAVLILQLVFVAKEFRRQGVASLLLQSVIENAKRRTEKTKKGKVKFVVVFPVVVKQAFEKEIERKTEAEKDEIEHVNYERAIKFYRAMGFRRIGCSKWFSLALDPGHKSRQVAAEDDLDPAGEAEVSVQETSR